MTLPNTYADQNCSLARALEVVGERWTLLIVRDAFYGVRRFGDFATQLGIPRAVLTARLKALVDGGVFARQEAHGGVEYTLTEKGLALWPVLRALMGWEDAFSSAGGARRLFRHDADGGITDEHGRCAACGHIIPLSEVRRDRGPGFDHTLTVHDAVSAAIDEPGLLLAPLA